MTLRPKPGRENMEYWHMAEYLFEDLNPDTAFKVQHVDTKDKYYDAVVRMVRYYNGTE